MPHAHPSRSRQGFAIVTATLVLVALMALAVALSDTTVGSMRMTQMRVADASLTISTESMANLAFNHVQNLPDLENELIKAKTRLASDKDAILSEEVLLAGTVEGRVRLNGVDPRITWKWLGTVNVPINGTTEKQEMYQLTATAAAGGPARYHNADGSVNAIEDINRYRRRRVEVLFTKFPLTSYRQAMFSIAGYDWMGSASTDSWNSNGDGSTPYGAAAKGAHGDLATNSNYLEVTKASAVQGSVTKNALMPIPKINCTAPGDAIALPDVFATTNLAMFGAAKSMPTGVYVCEEIKPSGDNSIIIAAGAKVDIYCRGPLTLKNDWAVPPSAILRIFQADYDEDAKAGTTINGNISIGCPSNPRSMQIYTMYDGVNTTDPTEIPVPWDVKMNGTAELGAVVVAPFTSFKLNGTFDYYGSLIAKSFRETDPADPNEHGKVNGNFKFHYDESLGNLEMPFPPNLVVVGWRSYDLGLAEFDKTRGPAVRYDDP